MKDKPRPLTVHTEPIVTVPEDLWAKCESGWEMPAAGGDMGACVSLFTTFVRQQRDKCGKAITIGYSDRVRKSKYGPAIETLRIEMARKPN